MTRSILGRWGLLTCLVLVGCLAQSATADDDAVDMKIAAALKTKTTLETIDAPLKDVIDYLKDFHDIPIKFDIKPLEAAKTRPDTPITIKDDTLTLSEALDKILGPLKLDHIIKDHALTITTAEVAKAWKKEKMKP